MKKWLLFMCLTLMCVGYTQSQTTALVAPTQGKDDPTGNGYGNDAIDKGESEASVMQQVTLILPKATALHLDTTELTFDLRSLDGEGWPHAGGSPLAGDNTIYCAYGLSEADEVTDLSGLDPALSNNYFDQPQTRPLGTYYEIDPDIWPNVRVHAGPEVTSYPPIRLDDNGELVPGSKNHFVCYKTFILQKFSNFPHWKLSVERSDNGDDSIEHLYLQGNPCPADSPTGFFAMNPNSTLELIPRNLTAGSTGDRAADYPELCGHKSWLDSVMVAAVKINSDDYGESTAKLTFTLTSSDNPF